MIKANIKNKCKFKGFLTMAGAEMFVPFKTASGEKHKKLSAGAYVFDSSRLKNRLILFKEGYNCAQAVFLAFEDLYQIDRKTAIRLSSSQ
mgnify:CR=1 FL=1